MQIERSLRIDGATLESRGFEAVRGLLRNDAAAVLELSVRSRGPVYNG